MNVKDSKKGVSACRQQRDADCVDVDWDGTRDSTGDQSNLLDVTHYVRGEDVCTDWDEIHRKLDSRGTIEFSRFLDARTRAR